MQKTRPLIAVTLGDITGIGPEIVAKTLMQTPPEDCCLLVVGDGQVLRSSFKALGSPFHLPVFRSIKEAKAANAPAVILDLAQGGLEMLALGKPNPEAGQMAAGALAEAAKLALDGRVDGIVYAPLRKETLRFGEKKYGDEQYLLSELLPAPDMKAVAKIGNTLRLTIAGHVPLREVPDLITQQSVLNAIEVLHETLLDYGFKSPHIGVAALNPHAGEGGLVGQEEIEHIAPAVEIARAKGIGVSGPIPADIIYVRARKGQYNGVVSLYHDQANIALKMAGFGEIVVFYVRCPIVIATPGHGTAYDIAGKGTASPDNLRAAIELAASLAQRRKNTGGKR